MSAEIVNSGGGDLKIKKKNEEDMVQQLPPYLGEDIITQILLKIPAESLFKTLRYVCKSWLKNISTHPDIHLNRLLPSKPPCLIIQNVDTHDNFITCFFTLTKEGMIEKQFDDLNPVLGNLWIRACCNGLILAAPCASLPEKIYVVNPLTNHKLIIPHPGPPTDIIYSTAIELVFIPSTGVYKVIVPGFMNFQILTLSASDCYGSSNINDRLQWRLIERRHQKLHGSGCSFVEINGILYWGTSIGNIVSLDARVEKIYETTYRHNNKRASGRARWGLIEIGGLLSSWSLRLEEYDDVWRFNVRVVKDFHGGEWIDKYTIPIDTDFMKKINDADRLSVSNFGNGEVLIFFLGYEEMTMWALNVKLNQWWKVGNRNMKENLRFWFKGLDVNNKTVPLESNFAIE